jgi:benzodiazapine receptor
MFNIVYYGAAVLATASLASYFTFQGLKTPKYVNSQKPSWFPPPALFGIVWSALYILYIYSWYKAPEKLNWLFILNMILNVLWCFLFFAKGKWEYALIALIALNIVLLTQVLLVYKHDTLAAMLLIPYFLWSCFATFLNYTMIKIN